MLGVFQVVPPWMFLKSNSTNLVTIPVMQNEKKIFRETSPSNPMFLVLYRVGNVCKEYNNPGCVSGYSATDAPLACKWTWNCLYTLYCAEGDDVGFYMIQPTQYAPGSNKVVKIDVTYTEIGPAHLLFQSGNLNVPNPNQSPLIAQATLEKVGD